MLLSGNQFCHLKEDIVSLVVCTEYSEQGQMRKYQWPSLVDLYTTIVATSEMIHHHGVSLSKQQTADLLPCHGTQQDLLTLSTFEAKFNNTYK